MSREHENAADELITHLEDCIAMKPAKPMSNKLEKIRSLAIEAFDRIKSLETREAYQERDNREYYRTLKVLEAAGLLDDEQVTNASRIVTEARGPNNSYTDVDLILKRNRSEALKERANYEPSN